MTASEVIKATPIEGVAVSIDHETRAFVGFKFHLSAHTRHTVVRIHRASPEFLALISAVA